MASMRRRTVNCCLFILTCWVVSWLFCFHSSLAGNILTVRHVMRDGEFLESSNKLFRLQFLSPDPQSPSTRYLGIQYVNTSKYGFNGMVWVANRGNPIPDSSGALNITHEGNLVITSSGGTLITVNADQQQEVALSSSNTRSATLLDTGNLVLIAGKRIVWQSFDYPSDTWLPGMKLGLFNASSSNRFLSSWVSAKVPNMGAFTLGVDLNNTRQLVIWKRGVIYWRSGMWNGYNFTYFADARDEFNLSYFSNESQSYFSFTMNDHKLPSLIKIDSSGEIVIYYASDSYLSFDHINYCDASPTEYKSSPGCVALEPSNCSMGDLFSPKGVSLINSSYYYYYVDNVSLGISDCEDMCRRNCSCASYYFAQTNGSGCKFSDGKIYVYNSAELIYIRNGTEVLGAVSDSSTSIPPPPTEISYHKNDTSLYPNYLAPNNNANHSRKKQLWLTIGVVIGGAIAFLVIFVPLSLWRCYSQRRNRHSEGNNGRSKDQINQDALSAMYGLNTKATIIDKFCNGKKDHELHSFNLSIIEIATDYFSDANKIGQGGFGPVYKGKLVNGQEIAVKRLSKSSRQGLEEFKNEVTLISRLQHRNLVTLLGCCAEGDERILIYEYLPNKSLDTFLFDVTGRVLLDWKMRVRIIQGIAQGLQYLHKDSRVRIIHRDLKTSNILLDENMNPKISDFGTARIFGDNESQANTKRIVGTYGYMSPEYALDGLFSVKSDVFSFGVIVLEIISGKKNTGFYQPDRALNLLGYAWDLWNEGRGLEIIDHTLVETSSTSEVTRFIQVSFLCVQESATVRPTISDVVSMLSNEMIVIPTPKQPAFSEIVSMNYVSTPEIPKLCSVNGITISDVEGR